MQSEAAVKSLKGFQLSGDRYAMAKRKRILGAQDQPARMGRCSSVERRVVPNRASRSSGKEIPAQPSSTSRRLCQALRRVARRQRGHDRCSGGGDFFGEGCLAGQSVRTATATAMSECSVLRIRRHEIARKLHAEESFADSFVSHVLKRNIRMEEDLIDQLFNSTEKRLARTILLLAQHGKNAGPRRVLPKISQEILAEMVGTTRPRVNFFMNKFRKLGFIEYGVSGVKVNNSLLGVVLAD